MLNLYLLFRIVLDFYIGEEMCKAETIKKLLICVKYEYELKFGPREELYDMEVDVETTIKEVKTR